MRIWGALGLVLLLAGACTPAPRQVAPNPLATATPPSASASPGPAEGVVGGTFRWGIGEPSAIVPPNASTQDDNAVVDAIFDSLTAIDARGRPVASAAVDWVPSDDVRTWTFALRPDATFHDGEPVTASAFMLAWSQVAAEGAMGHLLRDVVGYDAVAAGTASALSGLSSPDPLTLAVRFKTPRADFPALVSHPALGPVHPVAQPADPAGYGQQPIGNGPFRMTEPWAHGEFIRAVRWPEWRNGAGTPDGLGEVLFRIGDLDANFTAFRQGRRDFAQVPPEALELAAEAYPPTGGEYLGPGLITGALPEVYVFGINPAVEPYTDGAVREAAMLFVDREGIAATNAGGNLDPARSLLPPALSPQSVEVCDLCTFNPSGAASRLEDAGVRALTLIFNADGGHERIRDSLRDALGEGGFGLVSNRRGPAPDFATYLDWLRGGRDGMFRLSVRADVPSSLEVLYPLLHSGQTPEQGGLNYMRYADPVVDSLLDQAARTVDSSSRVGLLRRVEAIALNRDHVIVPVVTSRHAVVIGDHVMGARYDAYGRMDLTAIRLS